MNSQFEIKLIIPTNAARTKIAVIEHDLVTYFGGFTRQEGYGAWSDGVEEITEDVYIYFASTDLPENTLIPLLVEFRKDYKQLLNQQAIYISVTKLNSKLKVVE